MYDFNGFCFSTHFVLRTTHFKLYGKLPFLQSCLWHSKAYDNYTVVVDFDEIILINGMPSTFSFSHCILNFILVLFVYSQFRFFNLFNSLAHSHLLDTKKMNLSAAIAQFVAKERVPPQCFMELDSFRTCPSDVNCMSIAGWLCVNE
jgi:hypothetical protein